MKFTELFIEHFGPFRKHLLLPLADLGLVLVRGRNMVSAAADDNGAGKTSLFSALSWVLYGETLPGSDGKVQRADEVACRFTTEPCIVSLDLQDNGTPYRLVRGRRPTRVELWENAGSPAAWASNPALDAAATQLKIEQLVGFGALTFRNAVVLSQSALDRLATADQSAYLKMLDEIQGLSFKDALERAKLWRADWERRRSEAVEAGNRAALQAQQSETSIALLEEARDKFATEKAARIAAVEQMVGEAHAAISTAIINIDNAKPAAKRAATLRERWERLKELQTEAVAQQQAVVNARREAGISQAALDQLEAELQALLTEHVCPTCRRTIASKAEVAEVRKLFAAELQAGREAVAASRTALTTAEQTLRESSAVLERHRKQLPDGFTERQLAELEAKSGAAEIERLRVLVEQAYHHETEVRESLEREKARTWDSAAVLEASRIAKGAAEQERAEAETLATRCGRTVAAAEYWIEAFGDRGLRSLLFDNVADFLNQRLAHHLRILAAGEADVQVSALTALKKGTMKEKMSISAAWSWGANQYGAGSAGQSGRINLALVAAHQDLAEQRSARPFPLRIFDEPECHVDPRGQEILAQWIRNEAGRRGTTFLVTHNPVLADLVEPDRRLVVVLERDGARLEWEG